MGAYWFGTQQQQLVAKKDVWDWDTYNANRGIIEKSKELPVETIAVSDVKIKHHKDEKGVVCGYTLEISGKTAIFPFKDDPKTDWRIKRVHGEILKAKYLKENSFQIVYFVAPQQETQNNIPFIYSLKFRQ